MLATLFSERTLAELAMLLGQNQCIQCDDIARSLSNTLYSMKHLNNGHPFYRAFVATNEGWPLLRGLI